MCSYTKQTLNYFEFKLSFEFDKFGKITIYLKRKYVKL